MVDASHDKTTTPKDMIRQDEKKSQGTMSLLGFIVITRVHVITRPSA